jgi:tetratricopeptide (TPR) repeat protein
LGLLNAYADNTPTSLGEYKMVASRYPNNPLAPFALLNGSVIKTNIRDYSGARRDLTEIIIQYPDCKVVDEASLYHAEATMKSGLYDDAMKSFHRVYNLDLNEKSKRDAAYGLGRCYFETEDFGEARRWFITAIDLTENRTDQRLRNCYYMLGKSCIELGQFPEASAALANALDDSASREEFVGVILELVRAEVGQEKYVNALNILENVPEEKLSQADACAVLKAKAEVFRQIDLVDLAMTLLRRRIEFIADSQLRAELTFELAKCLWQRGDYTIARKEVTDAMVDLTPGVRSQEASILLAEISLKLGNLAEARDTCDKLLAQDIEDESLRKEALLLLGRAHDRMEEHDKAALVYAGAPTAKGVKLK